MFKKIKEIIGTKNDSIKKEFNLNDVKQYYLGREFYRILNGEEKITVYYLISAHLHYSKEYFEINLSEKIDGHISLTIQLFPGGIIVKDENTIPLYLNIEDAVNALNSKLELKRKELRITEIYLEKLRAELEYLKLKNNN